MSVVSADVTWPCGSHQRKCNTLNQWCGVRPFLSASPPLPWGLGVGGGGCLFQNGGSLLLMGPRRPTGWGVGQEWVGGFEGKGYIPGAEGAGHFLSVIVSFVLVSR